MGYKLGALVLATIVCMHDVTSAVSAPEEVQRISVRCVGESDEDVNIGAFSSGKNYDSSIYITTPTTLPAKALVSIRNNITNRWDYNWADSIEVDALSFDIKPFENEGYNLTIDRRDGGFLMAEYRNEYYGKRRFIGSCNPIPFVAPPGAPKSPPPPSRLKF